MSYQLRVLKDHPIGFWPLDESSGTTAYDLSSCGNNATYSSVNSSGKIPLVSGGTVATKIDSSRSITYTVANDYRGQSGNGSFGTVYSSDNDFSLECWYYPLNINTEYQTLLGDSSYCAIMANNTNIKFKLENESLEYTLPFNNKNIHVVATYHPDKISLYVNGNLAAFKTIDVYKFTNTTKTIATTATNTNSFLIDAPAIYRHELQANTILNHYLYNQSVEPIHIVTPDAGSLIEFYDTNLYTKFKWIYPSTKRWTDFLNEDLFYDVDEESLGLKYDSSGISKSIDIIDILTIPEDIELIAQNTKIDWDATSTVKVYFSQDGVTYEECSNGSSLPAVFPLVDSQVFIKINLSSSDTSKVLPSISNLSIKFMSSDDTVYSKNIGSYANNFVKACVLDKSHIMERNLLNGIKCDSDGTFDIYENFNINSIEFIYTPHELTATRANSFFPGNMYVNGVLKTQTNMSDIFSLNEPHHVVISTSNLSDLTDFNKGGDSATFQNIALYETQLTQQKITNHYNLYIGKPSITVQESSWSVTENAFKAYNNSWNVIQNS